MCSVLKSCLTLQPSGHSPPDSSVYGISQAKILEWVVVSSSRGSYWPRIQPTSPALPGVFVFFFFFFYHWATREAPAGLTWSKNSLELNVIFLLPVADFMVSRDLFLFMTFVTATKGELILFRPFFKLKKFLMKIRKLRLNLMVKSLAFCVCTHVHVVCRIVYTITLQFYWWEEKIALG